MATDTLTPPAQAPDFGPRYDMSRDAVQEVVGSYFTTHELPPGRFVGVVAAPDEPLANAARWLEREVFDPTFGNSTKQMQELYGPVEPDSRFIVVLDEAEKLPAGVMRVVGGEAAYTMSLAEAPKHIPNVAEDQIKAYHEITGNEKAWDVATMAIAKRYRGKVLGTVAISGILQYTFVGLGEQEGVELAFALLDHKARRSLEGVGVPFKPMYGHDEPFPYYGSGATYAMVGRLPEFRQSVAQRHEELSRESTLANMFHMGVHKALTRRYVGKVAGMAALGKDGVDKRIVLPTA
ncbi:MAG TPA: hypothetical protein VMY99_02160 [Nevskiaceae bacterium]|nr:hypothetical protein [Nevskiaceae bacterium]